MRERTEPGEWALIHGTADGVGLSAIQFAKARGAKVIATATSKRNLAVCKSFGADYVIDYMAKPEWEKEIMRITELMLCLTLSGRSRRV
jgi:NADPH2:quinone reductase